MLYCNLPPGGDLLSFDIGQFSWASIRVPPSIYGLTLHHKGLSFFFHKSNTLNIYICVYF